jgi:hypothetical protein
MKKQSGGKRKNAGRKPVLDKKVQVCLYVETSKIDKFGGIDEFKSKLYNQIDNNFIDYRVDIAKQKNIQL